MTRWAQILARLGLLGLLVLSLTGCPPPPPPAVAPVVSAPAALTVVEGQPAAFAVTATGTAPIEYQWQRNGTDIPGATSAEYRLPAATMADDGALFQARVSNVAGSVVSAPALLTVQPLVGASIATQPNGATATAGTSVTFGVQAVGTAPLSYQWQRDGQDIAGATASSYTLAAPGLADDGAVFRVVVTNPAGSITSTEAVLNVVSESIAAPIIVTQPESAAVLDGDSVVLSVAASGTGPFSYQWQRNGAPIAGATELAYTSGTLALADSGASFAVVVSNGGGSVTSNSATIMVSARPITITEQPAPRTRAPGETASFTVVTTGSDPKTYQWLRNGAELAGANASSYTTPALTVADSGARFAVRVGNAAGSTTSEAALLTVESAPVAPTIATQPESVTVTAGLPASFSVVAAGTGTLSYQWRRDGTAISGARAPTYTLPATVEADNAARFSVLVSSSAGSVVSAEAVLTVQAATGPLVGRAWATPQALEENTSTVSVRDRAAAIDDAGNVTVLFRKNNGSRDVLFATRGTPNGAGLAPTWSEPVAIDVLEGAPVSNMGTSPDYAITAAPGGDLVARWYHSAACTAATYRTSGTCRYYYYARYRAASGSWEAPVLLTDASSPGFRTFTNDRGDLVFFGNSWVRSGTTGSRAALALFMRAAGEATMRRQLLNAEPIDAFQLGMDAAGNLLMAAQYQQNATTDLVAYRGTVTAGLGTFQVLDSRGAAATLQHTAVGLNGQQAIIWTQNNGTASTTYAATSATPQGAFSTVDLGRVLSGGRYLVVTDAGDAIYASLVSRQRSIWSAVGGWQPWQSIPSTTPAVNSIGRGFAVNRLGDVLFYEVDNLSGAGGNTATYEASRNIVVLPAPPSSAPAPGWVLGFRPSLVGYDTFVLSTSGIGFTSLRNRYDVLPTVAAPAGDGRDVTNLWGVFLK